MRIRARSAKIAMEIERYRRLVKDLASRRNSEAIYNGSADHAAIIVEHLFGEARESVSILSGDLNAKVYGRDPVVAKAKQFLGHSDRKIEILLERVTLSGSHPLVEAIIDDPKVGFYHIPPELGARVGFHMMTADDDCFRFEQQKNTDAAVAAFGDRRTTTHLNTLFQSIRAGCVELDKSLLKV